MNKKPINPYTALLNKIKSFCRKVAYPHRKTMGFYAKSKLNDRWTLEDLYERTAAADQLGYAVKLEAREDGLYVIYEEKPPEIPWSWKY